MLGPSPSFESQVGFEDSAFLGEEVQACVSRLVIGEADVVCFASQGPDWGWPPHICVDLTAELVHTATHPFGW